LNNFPIWTDEFVKIKLHTPIQDKIWWGIIYSSTWHILTCILLRIFHFYICFYKLIFSSVYPFLSLFRWKCPTTTKRKINFEFPKKTWKYFKKNDMKIPEKHEKNKEIVNLKTILNGDFRILCLWLSILFPFLFLCLFFFFQEFNRIRLVIFFYIYNLIISSSVFSTQNAFGPSMFIFC